MRTPDGTVLSGTWRDGLLHGAAVSIAFGSDGSTYRGAAADGVMSGFGVLNRTDGSSYEGEWRNGTAQML